MGVLTEMLLSGLDVTIIPVSNNKIKLFEDIVNADFDRLISNGCKYILPVSQIKRPHQLFINVHPSLLPDLKGKSPILDAIKQNKPMGATCHHMADEVDSGPIISQVECNPNRKDLNDCYKKCFEAEVRAFQKALKRDFQPL